MKTMVVVCLLLVLPLAAIAVENGQVMYVGGTVVTLKEGMIGRLTTSSSTELTFDSAGSQLVIPFARIESYEYSQQVARHLGVLPAIATSLIRHRQKRHFLRIAYKDASNAQQVVVFEVPKQMPRALLAILQVRAPWGYKANAARNCGQLD